MPRPVQATGRPGTPVIPTAWSEAPRTVVEAALTGTCEIRHPGGTPGVFDPVTGTKPVTPFPAYFTGPCTVQVLPALEQQAMSGGQQVTTVGYRVTVAYDAAAALKVGDLVKVTAVDANGDPTLVGQVLKVQSFNRGTVAWERDIYAVDDLG